MATKEASATLQASQVGFQTTFIILGKLLRFVQVLLQGCGP